MLNSSAGKSRDGWMAYDEITGLLAWQGLLEVAYGFREDAYCFLKIRAAFPRKP